MKHLLGLKGTRLISKAQQKDLSGGWGIVAQNCPGPGGAQCPPDCHCNQSTQNCVWNAGTRRAGQFCYAY
ncbi:MAG: hypothetical protein AAFO69_10815 [Bacteroidota bacterium]